MDQEELRRALQSKAGIRCSDGALLGQLAAAAGEAGLAPRDAAAKLSAWLINECVCEAGAACPCAIVCARGSCVRTGSHAPHPAAVRSRAGAASRNHTPFSRRPPSSC
jgi:hypothetical protein